MQTYVKDLIQSVEQATLALRLMPDRASRTRPAPGKWSPSEIVGHLIDSASNNHRRFVRAQFQDDLVFEGYDQDSWVNVQRYQEAPWGELIDLWAGFNRHLARVMTAVPESVRLKSHRRHNLHQIAWQTLSPDDPATLDYFMADYVAHLQHHLRQILGAEWRPASLVRGPEA